MKFYELPDTINEEVKKFDGQIKEYQKGDLNPVAFKGIRVAHGIYEQRKPATHMVRIRCASGGITPAQLRCVGHLAQKYGSGEIHVTTRQEMQLHYVDLDNVINVYNEELGVGLSSRGGGGNTIRNIMSSHDSGILKEEAVPLMIDVLCRDDSDCKGSGNCLIPNTPELEKIYFVSDQNFSRIWFPAIKQDRLFNTPGRPGFKNDTGNVPLMLLFQRNRP